MLNTVWKSKFTPTHPKSIYYIYMLIRLLFFPLRKNLFILTGGTRTPSLYIGISIEGKNKIKKKSEKSYKHIYLRLDLYYIVYTHIRAFKIKTVKKN